MFLSEKVFVKSLIVLLLCLSVVFGGLTINAEEKKSSYSKPVERHEIAVVFDNSGSMYKNTEAWSQALYAMEVFASMIDYENKDRLSIYPMRDISIGKGGKKYSEKYVIDDKSKVENISKIYSPHTSHTILSPAYSAANDLKASNADKKWLIVLTDGLFFFDKTTKENKGKGKERTAKWLDEKLNSFANKSSKNTFVQYIGLTSEAAKLSSNEKNRFYACSVPDGKALIPELVNICNKIFKRNAVSVDSSGNFSLDVSATNVYAFVQGKEARINNLKNEKGKIINTNTDVINLSPGTEGSGNIKNAPIANDLSGKIAEYGKCTAGSYKIDYDGSIELYYEPDVVIKTTLIDSKGKEINPGDKINPGEYTVNYGLVDANTNKDVSQKLNASLSGKVKNNGKETKVANGGKVKLDDDSKTQIIVNGEFLDGYKITNEDDADAYTFNIKLPELKDLNVEVDTEQESKWFKLSDYNEWKPIDIKVTYNGKNLTANQTKDIKFDITPKSSKSFSYIIKKDKNSSNYKLYLGKDKNGKYLEPETGTYDIEVTANLKDNYGRNLTADDSIGVKIKSYSKYWEWLMWLLIIAAIIALVIIILNLPSYPARMYCVIESPQKAKGKHTLSPSGGTMRLVPYRRELSASIKKNTKVKDRFSKKSNIKVTRIIPNKKVQSYTIGDKTYTKDNQFKDAFGKEFQGIVRNGTRIQMTFSSGYPLSCRIEIN